MNEENDIKAESKTFRVMIIITSIIIILVFLFLWLPDPLRIPAEEVICPANLKHLGIAFQFYAKDNSNSYPIADKWCDLIRSYLLPDRRDANKIFCCPAAEKAKCHYAMNPNCEPNSPPDTVLLFETKGGWNLSGGPELLTTENHTSHTCNVLFNDGSVGRIRKDEIPNLKWNAEIINE